MLVTLTQVAIFTVYTTAVYVHFGVLGSISASSYSWEGRKRYWFWAFLSAIAILCWFHLSTLGFYGFLMAIGFVWAGLTLDHRKSDGYHDEIHTAGTVIAIVAPFAGMIHLYGMWELPLFTAVVGYIIYKKASNPVWWLECWFMITVATGILIINS